MSRTPSTQSEKITAGKSQLVSASSCVSLPPTDSMLSSSAPAPAAPSNVYPVYPPCQFVWFSPLFSLILFVDN